jgi:hypothetical protein
MKKQKKFNQKTNRIIKIIIVVLIFWLSDFFMHLTGVGETNYYYLSKFANSILFSIIFFFIFEYKEHWKKLIYSFAFGTWISFYYLISSYSGLVQFFGIYARYTAPPFVIFGIFLSPYFWWTFHSIVFYIGLEIAGLYNKN